MAFGPKQIKTESPMWAKWMFRATMLITTALSVWVAGTGLLSDQAKFEAILALKCIDPVIFGISKMFGVEILKQEEI
jgi:hypothetical protein